ncbi:DNA fragmentation factor subunit beta [Prorops nasuta]|uniref:DNA fragmentation factor subunit beta n=1 Tax=Prorops nasuta TaxID=863751 RepID=UPI0034CEC2F3
MSLITECFRRLTNGKSEVKGYKVTNVDRTRKFGIACRNLQELKRKACVKLNVTSDIKEVSVYLLDGSLIDDEYFRTLEPQTTLILQKPGERVLSDADLLYETLIRVNIDFLTTGKRASEFLTEKLKAKVAVLNKALNKDDSKTSFSNRKEHPEWFQGLETNATTKEAYMHRRCQDRIRGYLYKAIEQIRASEVFLENPKARRHLLQAISFFKMQLKEDHYFGFYFDRSRALRNSGSSEDELDSSECYEHCPCRIRQDESSYVGLFDKENEKSARVDETDARKFSKSSESKDEEGECPYKVRPRRKKDQIALCNGNGEFKCEGVWNTEKCLYGDRHRINPYRSKEELVLFSTWNLDHKIERSRTLIPQLIEISKQEKVKEKEIIDMYEKLFTIKNLRLVHIVCHDKGSHK